MMCGGARCAAWRSLTARRRCLPTPSEPLALARTPTLALVRALTPSPKPNPILKPKPKPKPKPNQVPGQPFRGSTAFLMGNEGHGLTEAQIAACDHFVYIPQALLL
jgi:hypothetical protein